jgi:hypothetical protein
MPAMTLTTIGANALTASLPTWTTAR